ncbi:hypothetical protein CTA1_2071 [Colletotrichum tanaceti]|uniref:Uncharacterized protein n=1 Tax=Colletotrichum tanaceti TaxID=1306861 RepID=A0A4U6X7W8_9PEZI|nr:hypothetical protein CTA1_2071 [Colletotrichum tanaceti]
MSPERNRSAERPYSLLRHHTQTDFKSPRRM